MRVSTGVSDGDRADRELPESRIYMDDMTTLSFAIDGGAMKPKLPCDLRDRSLFAVKGLDKLTNIGGNMLERAARRCNTGEGDFGHVIK